MGLLVTYDKVLDYHSFEYSQLAEAGRWDQSWELEQLRNRQRALVILEAGTRLDVDRYRRFTREFLSELDRNYRHTAHRGQVRALRAGPPAARAPGRVWRPAGPGRLEPGRRRSRRSPATRSA